MLLDELLATRNQPEPTPAPTPTLSIQPIEVPVAPDPGRRGAKQRIHELEDVARRNLRSAEEARHALFEEHERLVQESTARVAVEREASALRRELDRLREHEEQREEQAKHRAARAARAEIAEEIRRYHEEHDRVVQELDRVRGTLTDRDGMMEEYGARLREEAQGRAALRADCDRAEAAQRLAERALEQAMETARRRAEDELIQLASVQSQLTDVTSDRDRLAARLAELTSGERSIVEELEQERERVEELDALLAAADAELVRARADGDRLRAHAAALGDELAAVRASVVELQAAAPAPTHPLSVDAAAATPEPDRPPLDRRRPLEERPAATGSPVRQARRPAPAAASSTAPAARAEPDPVEPVMAPEPDPEPAPAEPAAPAQLARRTAMAEFTALASTNPDDDFSYRR